MSAPSWAAKLVVIPISGSLWCLGGEIPAPNASFDGDGHGDPGRDAEFWGISAAVRGLLRASALSVILASGWWDARSAVPGCWTQWCRVNPASGSGQLSSWALAAW